MCPMAQPNANEHDSREDTDVRIIVIGHGIAGLTSAHTLASSGHDVTIMAEDHYRNTVSSKACAVWVPIFLGSPRGYSRCDIYWVGK